MQETEAFIKKLRVQVHGDKSHRNEIVILAILSELGYTIIRANELKQGMDLYLNIGNMWDKKKFFDCPTDVLLDHFVETPIFKDWLLHHVNCTQLDDIVIKFLKGPNFGYLTYMIPTWVEDDDSVESDKLFREAIEMTRKIISRFIKSNKDVIDAEAALKQVISATSSKNILVLREYLPWNKHFDLVKSFEYIIYPAYGKWRLFSVPESGKYAYTGKKRLPKEWLTRKPKGCIGVQKKRSIAEFTTLDFAIESVC